MWIVLEGIDGSGKSTIAAELSMRLSADVEPLGPPKSPTTALDECIASPHVATYTPGAGEHLISDRLHWGCPVYGGVYRPALDVDGYGDFGRAGWRYAELFAESRGAATILVEVDPDLARSRIGVRGDDYVDVAHLDELSARYAWLAGEALTLGARVRSTKPDDVVAVCDTIIEVGREREARALSIAPHKHYVGSPTPATLVVCAPDRDMRLEIVGEMPDHLWQTIGFASSGVSDDSLSNLWHALERPLVLGHGKLPGHVENWIVSLPRSMFTASLDVLVSGAAHAARG